MLLLGSKGLIRKPKPTARRAQNPKQQIPNPEPYMAHFMRVRVEVLGSIGVRSPVSQLSRRL